MHKIGGALSRSAQAESKTRAKKGWRHGHIVEHFPHKHEALSSNPNTAKKATTRKTQNKTKI
jgi:hypothetical protein